MRSVEEVIVVEGRYDKNTLSQVVNAVILETGGFGIFKDSQKRQLLRTLAETRGLIILTDSDGAGFVIRNYIRSVVPQGRVLHAYIPDVLGKERRKSVPSREGKLGVEGMRPRVLLEALERAGAHFTDECDGHNSADRISKADLFAAGLSGKADSTRARQELLKRLNLPERLSANGLLDVLNALMTRADFFAMFTLHPPVESESSLPEEERAGHSPGKPLPATSDHIGGDGPDSRESAPESSTGENN